MSGCKFSPIPAHPLVSHTPRSRSRVNTSSSVPHRFACLIVSDHAAEMFTLVFGSVILYCLIFLRLRGNFPGFGWNFRLHRVNDAWLDDNVDESQMFMSGCCGRSPLLCGGSGRADVKSQVSDG